MVCLEIYTKYKTIKYKSTLCSKAAIIVALSRILVFLLPFILAYYSKGFWLKRSTFFEQPNIKYKYEYVFIAETNQLTIPIICSNIIQLRLLNNTNKCSTIKVFESDYNQDGLFDELFFSLTLENLDNLKIQSLILILPLDYKLYSTCLLHLQSNAIIQQFYNRPAVKMNFIGDVNLKQRIPIPCNTKKFYNSYTSLIKNDFELWEVIEEQFIRNLSIKIDNSHIIWTSGSDTSFVLEVKLQYNESMFYYKPNFWQVIKFAWIQYFAIFIVIKYIINKIENYIFTNKLVLYYVENSHKKFH